MFKDVHVAFTRSDFLCAQQTSFEGGLALSEHHPPHLLRVTDQGGIAGHLENKSVFYAARFF